VIPDLTSTPPMLPPRNPAGHKGTFGTVSVFGGCAMHPHRMAGAVALAARAALRTGCGLARCVAPAELCDVILAACPSATCRPILQQADGDLDRNDTAAAMEQASDDESTIVLGPGLGTSEGAQHATLLAVQQGECHLVLDADGINCLGLLTDAQESLVAPTILTPHPGEFARLARVLGLHDVTVQRLADDESRLELAVQLAQRIGAIVVLKGQGTIVTDGHRAYRNATGSSALATAGTGDVLAGTIAALVAQFVPAAHAPRPWPMPPLPADASRPWTLFEAACFGVHAHGVAADLWCAQNRAAAGLLAHEVADLLPAAMRA